MLRLSALLTCVFLSSHAQAAEPLPGPVPAEVVDIIDGDTVTVRARIWPGQFVETRVRLRGVDTPEIRRPDCEAERAAGHEASAFTRAWLTAPLPADPSDAAAEQAASPAGPGGDGATSSVRSFTPVSLMEIDLGSFAGRVVARIQRLDGADLSEALIGAELAVVYGEDGPWCAGADEAMR